MRKNQCAYCKEEGHWKVNCPRFKKKKDSKIEANVAMADGNESGSYVFSLSITSTVCYSEESEWILEMGATYHACLEESDLIVLKN